MSNVNNITNMRGPPVVDAQSTTRESKDQSRPRELEERADRIDTKENQRLDKARVETAEVVARRRGELIADIKAKMASGTYKPEPGRIAEAILREAEIAAELRSLLL